jgi:hypothetical protein
MNFSVGVSAEQTIVFITYFISVYIGYFILITGLIGNLVNVLVFTQLKIFRRKPSAFYLTAASIVDCCQLIVSTAIRVTTSAFGFDPTRTSLVWCKLRIYFIQVATITSTTTICFAGIDQYLSACYYAHLRIISTFKLAQQLISILLVFAALCGISFPIFYEIRPNSGCSVYHQIFNYYYSFVHLCIIVGLLPIIISSLFSLLAYQNVRRIVRLQMAIVRRRLDRQLTAMILVRVALFVVTTLPFVVIRIYQINNPIYQHNNTLSIAIGQLITIITNTFYSINYTVFDFDF